MSAALREAFEAIPPQCNPHVASARKHVREWTARHDLVVKSAARERFERADFGWFAAVTYPTADEAGLLLVADWFAWLFLLDDQLDDGPLGKDPGRTTGLMKAIFKVLTRPPGGRVDDPDAPSMVKSLADLWARTTPAVGETWRQRFVNHVIAGGLAAGWEADNRTAGVIPDEESYIDNRRHTGAIYVCMDLIEIVEHMELSEAVYESAPFAEALRAACDVVCWTNDLYSLDKESSLGENHNLVTVIQHARRLSQAQAAATVADRIAERLREFLSHERDALAARLAQPAQVRAYLAGMRSWMRGNHDWSAGTRRYRDALHRKGNPADYLEPELVGPVGHAIVGSPA